MVDDPAAAAAVAAEVIARSLGNAVRRRGVAFVAFSGGSTPALMLAGLAALDVPWSGVHAFQVDERVVPDGDQRRNIGLLSALPLPARRVHAMPVTATALPAAARRYAAALPQRFDVVHLGLGDDGHTASWPPGDPVVNSTLAVDLCAEFNGTRRMTLTPAVVNAARRRVVLAPGADKAAPLAGWLLGDPALPIQRVHRTATMVVVDRAGAARLPPHR